MKHLLIILFLLSMLVNSLGQQKDKICLITNSNDTICGYMVTDIEASSLDASFFRGYRKSGYFLIKDKYDSASIYSADSVNELYTHQFSRWVHLVKMPGNASRSFGYNKPVFLTVVNDTGAMKLYSWIRDEVKTAITFPVPTTGPVINGEPRSYFEPQQLQRDFKTHRIEYYIKEPDGSYTRISNRFVNFNETKLKKLLSDCPLIREKIKDARLLIEEIPAIVAAYNKWFAENKSTIK